MAINDPYITIHDLLLALYEDRRALDDEKIAMSAQDYILKLIDKIKLAEKLAKKEKNNVSSL